MYKKYRKFIEKIQFDISFFVFFWYHHEIKKLENKKNRKININISNK